MTRRVVGCLACCVAFCLPLSTTPAQSSTSDPLVVIAEYERLSNAHDVEQLMRLYADDARLDFGPMGVLSGKARIRGVHEYDLAIGTGLRLEECRLGGHSVVCRTVEQNEWLRTAGIDELTYTESVFSFGEDGLIESVSATLAPASAEALGGAMASFGAWASEHRPEEYGALFRQDGSFDFGFETGQRVLALLHEWRESR